MNPVWIGQICIRGVPLVTKKSLKNSKKNSLASLFLLSFSMFWRTRPGAKRHALRRRDTRADVNFSWVTFWRHSSLPCRRLPPNSVNENSFHPKSSFLVNEEIFWLFNPNWDFISPFCYRICIRISKAATRYSLFLSIRQFCIQGLFLRLSGGEVIHHDPRCLAQLSLRCSFV